MRGLMIETTFFISTSEKFQGGFWLKELSRSSTNGIKDLAIFRGHVKVIPCSSLHSTLDSTSTLACQHAISGLSLAGSSTNGSSSTVHSVRPQNQSARTPTTSTVPQEQLAALEEGSLDDELDDAEVDTIERHGSFWSSEGTAAVVDWISDPENYCRLNNPRPIAGSRVQDIHQEIVNWIKAEMNVELGAKQVKSKVGYIKRKYREALALSSTGVGGTVLLHRQKIRCPPFERLHAVFNSNVSLNPPECRLSEASPIRSAALDLSDVEELDHSDFSESVARPQGGLLGFSESIDRLNNLIGEQTQAYSDIMVTREAEFSNLLARRDREARASLDEELERKRRRVDTEIIVDRERARAKIAEERLNARTEISEERQRFRNEIAEERQRLRNEIAEERQRLRNEIVEERQRARTDIAEEKALLKKERERVMKEMVVLIREHVA